jgi:hypothetical protein
LWLSDSESHDNQSSAAVAPTDECGVRPSQTADRIETDCGQSEFAGGDRMTDGSSRRNQALSVFLSTIMVLSVVAIGVAGFAGSAGATSIDPVTSGGDVTVTASSATSGETDQTIVIRFKPNNSDLSALAGNDGNITIDTPPGVLPASPTDSETGDMVDGDDFVLFYEGDGDLANDDSTSVAKGNIEIGVNGTNQGSGATGGTNQLVLDVTTGGNEFVNGSNSVFTVEINPSGSDTDAADIVGGQFTVNIESDGDTTNGFEDSLTGTLAVDENAPVTQFNADGTPAANFSTLGDALAAVDATGEFVTVNDDLTLQNDPAEVAFSGGPYSLTQNDMLLNGSATISIDTATTALGASYLLQVDDGITGVSIEDLTIDDTAGGLTGAVTTADSSKAEDGLTIASTTFRNFAGTTVVDLSDSSNAMSNVTVTDNVFDVGDTAVIDLNANLNGGDGGAVEFLNVSGNDLTFDSASNDVTGMTLTVAKDTNDGGAETIADNVIDGTDNSSSGTGIDLSGDKADLTISGGSVANVSAGITSSTTGTSLTITDVTLTDLGSEHGVKQTGDVGALVIDAVDVTGDASSTQGVQVTSTSDVDVRNSTIDKADIGVDADDANAHFNVSNTTITASDSFGIQITDGDGGSDATTFRVNDGSRIDQAGGTAGIDIATLGSTAGTAVAIDAITVENAPVGILFAAASNGEAVDITDSTIANTTTAGLQFTETSDIGVTVNFNSFENNEVGIDVDADLTAAGTNDLTFNDFEGSTTAGLDVVSQTSALNAAFSYWGSDAGPNSAGGDSVSLSSSADATTEPFLRESAVDYYDDSNLGGTNVLRFGHNVEVTNNKGSLAFPAVANRTAGEAIEGDTTNVMIYKLVDGAFVDAGDQVPQTMEGHVVDLTEATNDSAFVTITYSDDVADSSGGYTYEQGANLVGAPIQGFAGIDAVFNLKDDYVISPYLSNTENSLAGSYSGTSSIADDGNSLDQSGDEVSPFSAYVIEVPSNETRFKGGNIPGGTDASEIDALLLGN